ncbi:MAG TPA: helix-turn-helix transcriptional regulator [Stenomitos sp.]
MDDRYISERIRALREEAGLSQQEIAAELNLCQSAYSRRETGDRTFSAGEVWAIARRTGTDIRKIFG